MHPRIPILSLALFLLATGACRSDREASPVPGSVFAAADVVPALRARAADPWTDVRAPASTMAETIAAADSLVHGGVFSLKPFAPVRLDRDVDWGADPHDNRSWPWALHCYAWMKDLLAAHAETGDDVYLAHALELVADWEADNLVEEPPSEMTWHDQATGMRLERLLDLLEVLRRREATDEADLVRLLELIRRHGAKLMDESFYTRHTNHGFDQAFALARLGLALPELPNASRCRETGLARLMDECDFAFDDHGVHRENSPAYHFYMIPLVFRVSGMCEAYGVASDGLDATLAGALAVAPHLLLPNGEMPLVGDTHARASKSVPLPAWLPERDAILYGLDAGRRGVRPELVDLILPESGYAVLRERWGDAEDFDRPVALVMKLAANSRYHFHDDILSFVLYGRGERWLIDCGIYKYDYRDPLRIHVAGRLAHNVVTVDDGDRTAKPGPLPTAWRASRATGERVWIEAGYDPTPSVSHTRSLLYLKPELVLIRDVLTARDGESHDYKQIFHVDRDKDVIEHGDGFVLRSRRDPSLSLTVACVTPGAAAYRVRGQTDPHLQGWASYAKHEIEPVDVVGFRQTGTVVEFRTILSFGPDCPQSVDLADWNFEALSRP